MELQLTTVSTVWIWMSSLALILADTSSQAVDDDKLHI